MKIHKIIHRIFQLCLILFLTGIVGCEESADLNINPIEVIEPFTFEPAQGAPGTTVSIEGTGLNSVSKVSFGVKEAGIISKNDSKISVTVPAGAVNGKIKLVRNGLVITSATDFTVEESPYPTIAGFDPPIAGSMEEVTITGSTLDLVDSVYTGELKAELISQSETELKIITPEGLQDGNIILYFNYMTDYGLEMVGTSESETALALKLATIESITPDITTLNVGDELTFTGSLYNLVTSVAFGDIEAGFTVISDTEMKVTVPEGATTGAITLTIPDGATVHSTDYVITLPELTGFFPQKGDDLGTQTRDITITGTKLDLVTNVKVGSTDVEIVAGNSTNMTIRVPGSLGGNIALETSNGPVLSDVPFILTGEFWLADWDTEFEVARFGRFANNNLTSFAVATVNDAGNNYAEISMGGAKEHGFYIWGAETGTNDRFSLFTPNPDGVFLEFDMKVASIPDSLKQEDGTFKFKIFMMDALGWGAGGEYSYGSNGPTSYVHTDDEWQHFKMELADFVASTNSGLYTSDPVTNPGDLRPEAWCHPNSLRIIAFVFGTANESGVGDVVFGLDNMKFTIE
jgi:hypothetical protein